MSIYLSKLIIISGCSGSGKSYLLNNLEFIGSNYNSIKKKTTRLPRMNEKPEENIEFIFNCTRKEVQDCDFYYSFRDELYGFNSNDIDTILLKNINAVIIIRSIDIIVALKEIQENIITIVN